jgi:hypothetical protein
LRWSGSRPNRARRTRCTSSPPRGRSAEQHTIEEAREAADAYTRKLGFEGLQMVRSLQNDDKAGLYHLHAVFNLVDPETKTGRSTWREVRSAERPASKSSSRAAGNVPTTGPNARRPRKRANALSVAELHALERPAAVLAALTTHEVAFSLADARAAIMLI